MAAWNYLELMPRLTAIHREQNQARDDLLKVITDNPALVQFRSREDGLTAVALRSPDQRLQAALQMFFEDPRVHKALQSAVVADANSDTNSHGHSNDTVTAVPAKVPPRPEDVAVVPSGSVPSTSQPSAKPIDDFDPEAEHARIRAAKFGQPRVQELSNGLHPLIDQWLKAKTSGDDVGQRAAADAIASDPAVRGRLKPLSGPNVDALRLDLDAAEERALRKEEAERKQRQQQLALNLQRLKGVDWS